MSNIGKNIKKIRAVKKLSQAKFAELFNLARPSIGAYEEGRSEPKIDTLIQISEYFKIKIDHLLSKEVTVNEIHGFDIFKNKAIGQHTAQKIGNYLLYVPKEHLLSYPKLNQEKEYINHLPTTLIPNFSGQNNRVFELDSNAMNSIGGFEKGNLLVSEEVNFEKLKRKEAIIVITKDDVIFGRVTNLEDRELSLSFDNPIFQNLNIEDKKIQEIWSIKAFLSYKVPEENFLNKRLNEMEDKISYLITKKK